jgi:hypothetical protein
MHCDLMDLISPYEGKQTKNCMNWLQCGLPLLHIGYVTMLHYRDEQNRWSPSPARNLNPGVTPNASGVL